MLLNGNVERFHHLKMTRIGRRLIEDFLLPALNNETYGDLLKWIDRDKGYFCIRWSHKNAAKWTLADTAVFQDWDKLKGHYHPEMKGYYMQAKQRFRAALYKLTTVRKLTCEDKHVKKYQLVLSDHKRHHEIMPRKSHKYVKEDNQKSIPTPVICRNTSFIAKPQESYAEESMSSSSPPTSPLSSIKSEDSDRMEELECLEEYKLAREKQLLTSYKQCKLEPNADDINLNCLSSVLRESPQLNIRRTPHVPIQPVPVYGKCSNRHAMAENSQKRVESPHVLLVRTYNDSDTEADGNQMKKIKAEPITENCNGNAENKQDLNSDGALNLSTKCNESEPLSR